MNCTADELRLNLVRMKTAHRDVAATAALDRDELLAELNEMMYNCT